MFTGKWTADARATFDRLQADAAASLAARTRDKTTKATKAEGLFKQVQKCLAHLLENPRHPGLQTHKYHSLAHPYEAGGDVFEAYVQNRTPGAYRVFWCYGPGKGDITLIAITPHP